MSSILLKEIWSWQQSAVESFCGQERKATHILGESTAGSLMDRTLEQNLIGLIAGWAWGHSIQQLFQCFKPS